MTRLAGGNVRHLVRSVGSVRGLWRPVVGAFRGTGDNQKRQQHTKESSINRERSLDPLVRNDIDSEIRSGLTNTLERPSSLQRPESELPINNARLGNQGSGLPDLLPQEEAIFNRRLLKIWKGLMLSINADWKEKISRLPSDVWLSRIAEHIPTDVKLLLVSPQPPSLTRLNSLPWSETTDSGVFAWGFKPNGKQASVRNTDYLFIDSASRYSGGLRTRRRRLLFSIASPSLRLHDEALMSNIKCHDLIPDGELITLFVVPIQNGSNDDVMNDIALPKLARMVLMIWLGAVDEGLNPEIKDLVPWGLEHIRYLGLAGDHPLTRNLNGTNGDEGERKIASLKDRGRET